MIYYARPDHPTIYAMSAKCGCTSLQRVLKDNQFRKTEVARDGRDVLLVVRHPLERLVSAWSYLKIHPTAFPGAGLSFPAFVQFTEEQSNVHWQSQVEFHSDEQGFIPTRTIPLEQLDELWPAIGVGEMPRLRTSKHDDWQSYYDVPLAIAQAERYADDLALYMATKRRMRSH